MIKPSDVVENLKNIRERIACAAECVNKKPEDITLVAVTKYVHEALIKEAVKNGITKNALFKSYASKKNSLGLKG